MALDPLYQTLLLEHYRYPRNFGKLAAPTHRLHLDNPLCGDQIDLELEVSNHDTIAAIKFTGRGCVISQASASLMTQIISGKSQVQARALLAAFQELFLYPAQENVLLANELRVFAALNDFPGRVPCALLAWQAFDLCLSSPVPDQRT